MTTSRHGTTGAYSRGCRCDACRAAIAAYRRRSRLAATAGAQVRMVTRSSTRSLPAPVADPVACKPWRPPSPHRSPTTRPQPSPRAAPLPWLAVGDLVLLVSLSSGHDVVVPTERPDRWGGAIWCPGCGEPAPYKSLRTATTDDLPTGTRSGRYVVTDAAHGHAVHGHAECWLR